MTDSPLIKSLMKDMLGTTQGGIAPSNLATHFPPALPNSASCHPLGVLLSPRGDDQPIGVDKHILAPRSTNLRLVKLATQSSVYPSGYSGVARQQPQLGAIMVETLMGSTWRFGPQIYNTTRLARLLLDVMYVPAASSESIIPTELAETEGMEDWVDLGEDIRVQD